MSVINQMLKDLDQRTPEQGQAVISTAADQNPSTLKVVLISVVVLLSLNALGFYIWDLQVRAAQNSNKQDNSQQLQAEKQPIQLPTSISPQEEQLQKQEMNSKEAAIQTVLANENATDTLQSEKKAQAIQPEAVTKLEVVVKPTEETLKETTLKEVTEVVAVEKAPVVSETVEAPVVVPVKMSVSRRQLTSKELVAQKLLRAEKSVNMNEIAKAEQLFEEILIIDPTHKQARKNLAALWFGRKSYQQALNLLSQGISIDKQDGELRLLKARIHLQQGQHEAAYNTLKSLADFEHEEYQVMLANIAQQIEQYPSAISAYKVLIKMQPYSGRWHLGLAIIYDKNSQFIFAKNEYAQALTKADLSVSSAKFAEQRLQALGE